MTFVFFPAPNNLMPNQIAFWFLMQIGMIIGYFTSWPAKRVAGQPGHQGADVSIERSFECCHSALSSVRRSTA
jgi:hypothetical protein